MTTQDQIRKLRSQPLLVKMFSEQSSPESESLTTKAVIPKPRETSAFTIFATRTIMRASLGLLVIFHNRFATNVRDSTKFTKFVMANPQ